MRFSLDGAGPCCLFDMLQFSGLYWSKKQSEGNARTHLGFQGWELGAVRVADCFSLLALLLTLLLCRLLQAGLHTLFCEEWHKLKCPCPKKEEFSHTVCTEWIWHRTNRHLFLCFAFLFFLPFSFLFEENCFKHIHPPVTSPLQLSQTPSSLLCLPKVRIKWPLSCSDFSITVA